MEEIPRPSGHKIPYLLQVKLAERKKEEQEWQVQDQSNRPLKGKDRHGDDTVVGVDDKQDHSMRKNSKCARAGAATDANINRRRKYLSITDPTALEAPRLSHHNQPLPAQIRKDLTNRTFTAYELEERMYKTTTAIANIQRQLYRGEEVYYEETYGHGNIFRGWDGLVDLKDIGGSSGGGGGMGGGGGFGQGMGGLGGMVGGGGSGGTGPVRRVPASDRWFSGSCQSVTRMTKPVPPLPPKIKAPTLKPKESSYAAAILSSSSSSSSGPYERINDDPADVVSAETGGHCGEKEPTSLTDEVVGGGSRTVDGNDDAKDAKASTDDVEDHDEKGEDDGDGEKDEIQQDGETLDQDEATDTRKGKRQGRKRKIDDDDDIKVSEEDNDEDEKDVDDDEGNEQQDEKEEVADHDNDDDDEHGSKSQEESEEDDSPPTKKSRKSATASNKVADAPTRKRGRPPKLASSSAPAASATTKRRGRPPKSATKQQETQAEQPKKKRRGRPPKNRK